MRPKPAVMSRPSPEGFFFVMFIDIWRRKISFNKIKTRQVQIIKFKQMSCMQKLYLQ
jgi:hypothetical protein